MPPLRDLLPPYFLSLRIDNWSQQTVDRRKFSLGRFLDWAEQRECVQPQDLRRELLEPYRRSLFHHRQARNGQPLSFATQASYLTAVKHWLGWLHREQHAADDLSVAVTFPKSEKRLPGAYLTIEEVDRLLDAVDLGTPSGVRDRTMFEVLYSTGIRRFELIALELDSIDRSRGLVRIEQGKNRKDRYVPIGRRAIGWVEKYQSEIRPQWLRNPTQVLFLSTRGNTLHPNTVNQLLRPYYVEAEIEKPGSVHIMRHTAATLMLEGGADLRSLQTFLGHEHLNTTQIYTHITLQRLREIHKKTHPGERRIEN